MVDLCALLEDPEGAERFSKEDKSLCRTLVAALPLLFVVPTECCQNLKHSTDKRAKPILDKVHPFIYYLCSRNSREYRVICP